jgi:hypothetical protein
MGLLDDLKKQADAKKATEQQAALSQQEREQYYQDVLHPGMLNIYNYLNEMISHLNYLEQPTTAQYPLLPGKEKLDLNQGYYKIVIDSTQTTKNITLSFECQFPNLLEVNVEGKDRIEDYTDTLNNYKVRYERRDKKDEDFKLVEACFKVEGPVFASVTFAGDVEQSRINLFLRNVEKPGLVKHVLKSDHLHDEFLDRLAKYLIRESDDFLKLDIDESAKQQIRKNLQAANQQREQELIEAEKRLQEEQEAEKNKRTHFDTLIEKLKPKK